jgi:TP901 family phage tail tape measure protein
MATDLRVQIGGDAALLNRTFATAEARAGKFTASIKAQSDEQAAAYTRAGRSASEASAAHSVAMQKMGDNTVAAGRRISAAGSSVLTMVAPLDLAGAAAGRMAVNFSKAMEQLHTQAGYSQRDVESLSKSVEKLSPKVGASPDELAEGLYHVASAGIPAAKAMEIVKEAAIGAKIGGASLNDTTYALVSVMKSAPKDIKSAADAMGLMNAIVGQGDLHMQDLVKAFETGVIPAANAAGLGLRDVGAALDILTQRGIPAEVAGTRLKQTFAFMEKSSSSARKALEEIGITQDQLGEDMRKPNGLLVGVEDLKKHLDESGKSTTEQNRVLLSAFGGGRSGGAIQALVQNVKDLREQYQKLPTDSEAVKKLGDAWADFQKIPAQQLARDQQEVNVGLIEMGKDILPAVLPVVKDLAGEVGALAHDFEGLSAGQKQAAVDFAIGATAIGLISKPVGALVSGVGLLEKGVGSAGAATSKFTGLFGGSLEEMVPVAESAGAAAGTAYGAAFGAAASRNSGSIAVTGAGAAERAAFEIPGYGSSRVPGFGPSTGGYMAGFGPVAGRPGLGPRLFSAAEQDAALGETEVASPGRLSRLGSTVAGGLAGNGIPLAIGGVVASQVAGDAVGGRSGSDISSIGTGASIGAGIGTVIAPGLGTAIGAAIGSMPGIIKAFEGASVPDRAARAAGQGLPSYGADTTRRLQQTVKQIREQEHQELARLNPVNAKRNPYESEADARASGRLQPTRSGTEMVKAEAIKSNAGVREGEAIGKQEASYVKSGAVLANIGSIITTTEAKFKKLAPAARDGMYGAMLGMVKELEKQGRLPTGAAQKFIDTLHKQFNTLGTYSKQAAATTVQEWDLMKQGGAALKGANDFVGHILGAQKQIPLGAKTTSRETSLFFSKSEHELLEIAKHRGGERHKIALDAYHELHAMDTAYYETQRQEAVKQLSGLNDAVKSLSHKGSRAFISEWQGIQTPLKKLWEEGYVTTKAYTQKMQEVVTGELTALGITPDAVARKSAKFGPGPGAANGLINGLPEGVGKAAGGWIGSPGERGQDEVPIWVGRGEAVANTHQQPYIETGLAASKALGIQPYGSLHELFAGVQTPHYMATGGIVAPQVPLGGQVGAIAQGALNVEATAANRLLRAAQATSSVVRAAGRAPTGGSFSPTQVGAFDGLQVADWIIPELAYARAHGWMGHITSGIRLGYDPHAPDGSEHALDVYPGGAVDFGGMVDPAAAANRAAFIKATATYHGKRLLTPIGFRDDGHMSGTGHARGGYAFASGGHVSPGRALENTNKALHKKYAPVTRMLEGLWKAAAPYYHRAGSHMRSPIYTSGENGLFVGVEQEGRGGPGHRNFFLPDWIVQGQEGGVGLKGMDPEMLQLMLHEWTHEYQNTGALNKAGAKLPKRLRAYAQTMGGSASTAAEGGAQAFAQTMGSRIFSAAGMGNVHPRNFDSSDHYFNATQWVEKDLGPKWIQDTQFGHAKGGFAGAPRMAGGGFVATAYGPPWEGIEGGGVTATGVDLKDAPHKYIVAVDPSVIPLGTEMKIWPNPFGYSGNFLAADTGGAIKGNRLDFYDWQGRAAQNAWGRRNVTVTQTATVSGGKTKAAAPAHLALTSHDTASVARLSGEAQTSRSAAVGYAHQASEVGSALQLGQARWAAIPESLATTGGAHAVTERDQQIVSSNKAKKKYYDRELKALQKEAKNWSKLRDSYRKFARHAHGKGAKKEALDKAASYEAKVQQAQAEAKELKGTIYSAETEIIEAKGALAAVPGEAAAAQAEAEATAVASAAEVPNNDYSAYQAANSKIDLEERAGILAPEQAKAAKEANANKALAGGYGALSEEGLLQVKGDLLEFSKATQEATSAQQAHTEALREATKALTEFTTAGNNIAQVESGSLAKSLADMVSGQIAGVNYQGRRMTAGAGSAARY